MFRVQLFESIDRSIKLGIGRRVEFSARILGVESNLPRENNSIIYRGEDRSTFATFRNVPRLLTRKPLYAPSNFQQGANDWKGRIERNENYWQHSTATLNSSRLLNFYKLPRWIYTGRFAGRMWSGKHQNASSYGQTVASRKHHAEESEWIENYRNSTMNVRTYTYFQESIWKKNRKK